MELSQNIKMEKLKDSFYFRHLPKVIILLGLGFIGFFSVALIILALGLSDALLQHQWGVLLLKLIRWGGVHPHAQHYEAMISVIYIVWGWCLVRASSKPYENSLFLDFTLVANVAHFGLMTGQAFIMPNEMIHLIGDLLLGWASLLIFAGFWLPSRSLMITNKI